MDGLSFGLFFDHIICESNRPNSKNNLGFLPFQKYLLNHLVPFYQNRPNSKKENPISIQIAYTVSHNKVSRPFSFIINSRPSWKRNCFRKLFNKGFSLKYSIHLGKEIVCGKSWAKHFLLKNNLRWLIILIILKRKLLSESWIFAKKQFVLKYFLDLKRA